MASRFILSNYSIEVNVTKEFKHYFTENIFGHQFLSDTPFKPKRGHELIGIQKPDSEVIDVRKLKHSEIQDTLRKYHGKFGKTVCFHIAIPNTPLFDEIIESTNVSAVR